MSEPEGIRGHSVIRAALADDQALVRSGFAALLDAEDDITVVGEAADGAGAVRLAAREKPDVLLMDIRMPGLDGIEATRKIAADPALRAVHVIILTTFELDEYIFAALRSGAAGFLVKDTDAAELIRAVRTVAAGEALLSPGVTRRLIAEFAARTRDARPVRGTGPHRGGPVQRGDRRADLRQSVHGEDAHRPSHDEARRAGPGSARGVRL
jgi:DNA-binding NarL/FixJ family response regulator